MLHLRQFINVLRSRDQDEAVNNYNSFNINPHFRALNSIFNEAEGGQQMKACSHAGQPGVGLG